MKKGGKKSQLVIEVHILRKFPAEFSMYQSSAEVYFLKDSS
jgi:hypothetical protein